MHAVHHCGFKLKCSKHFYCCFGQTLVNFINVTVVMQNWNNIRSNVYVYTGALLSTIWFTKKSALSISVCFDKNSLIVAYYCTFGRFQIWTLATNRLKNQTNDKLKLLCHSCNHLQGFAIRTLTQTIFKTIVSAIFFVTEKLHDNATVDT